MILFLSTIIFFTIFPNDVSFQIQELFISKYLYIIYVVVRWLNFIHETLEFHIYSSNIF